jgi:hypothetical protein
MIYITFQSSTVRVPLAGEDRIPPRLVPLGLPRPLFTNKPHFLISLFSPPFIVFLAFFYTKLKPTTLIYPKNLRT